MHFPEYPEVDTYFVIHIFFIPLNFSLICKRIFLFHLPAMPILLLDDCIITLKWYTFYYKDLYKRQFIKL